MVQYEPNPTTEYKAFLIDPEKLPVIYTRDSMKFYQHFSNYAHHDDMGRELSSEAIYLILELNRHDNGLRGHTLVQQKGKSMNAFMESEALKKQMQSLQREIVSKLLFEPFNMRIPHYFRPSYLQHFLDYQLELHAQFLGLSARFFEYNSLRRDRTVYPVLCGFLETLAISIKIDKHREGEAVFFTLKQPIFYAQQQPV